MLHFESIFVLRHFHFFRFQQQVAGNKEGAGGSFTFLALHSPTTDWKFLISHSSFCIDDGPVRYRLMADGALRGQDKLQTDFEEGRAI